jgi:hypothetical protein
MQTNRHNHRRLPLLLLTALVALVSVFLTSALTGAENERPEQVKVQPEADEQAPEDVAAEAAGKQLNAGQTETEAEPVTEFKPSEQIGADSAVSFPIDI